MVELSSSDGVILEGTLRRAPGPGAVLFVPDLRGSRLAYTPYAQLLFIDDITTLSVDPRGHGASRADSLLSYDDLSEYHRARLIDDIGTAYRHLRSLGFRDEHIAVVSEGSGCALVEKAMQEEKATPAVTHLSPEFDPRDRDLIHAITFHPDLPVLVFFSDEDIAAMRSTQIFRETRKRSQLRTRMLRDAGRGLDLFRRNQEALEEFQEWARRTINTP